MQMVPVMFPHKTIKQLNSWFSSFIWSKKKPSLDIATLCLPSLEGGLDLPENSSLVSIADWVLNKSTSLWLDVESALSKYPLSNLLFIRKNKFVKSACTNPVTLSQRCGLESQK